MQKRECIAFERTRDTDQRLHEPCACLSPVLIPSSTNRRMDIYLHSTRYKFFLSAAKKKNDAVKLIVSWKQNNSEGFIGAPKILFNFKKRPNMNLNK